jgi:hypothetical protein
MYDPVFGLPITESDDMDVLASGARTQKLVSYIGKLVSEGYSSQWIEDEVRRLATERLPDGDEPISEASWQNELLPAIHRFQGKMQKESGQPPPPPPAVAAPLLNVPGLLQSPTAPKAPVAPPAPQPFLSDRPDVNRPLEEWVERYVYVSDGQFVIDTHKPLISGTYTAADFEKTH